MKILIVEDEPKVASFFKKGLEENHYEADIFYDLRISLLFCHLTKCEIRLIIPKSL